MLILYAGVIAGTLHLARTTPTGFIPDQDQGYLIGVVQLPSGASLDRTTEVVNRAAAIARKIDGITNTVIIAGFDGATFTNTTNAAVMFLTLKNAKERAAQGRSAAVITGDVMKATAGIQSARSSSSRRRRCAASARAAASRCRSRAANPRPSVRFWRRPAR